MNRTMSISCAIVLAAMMIEAYAQSGSAIEFYDTTGTESTSKIGWSGNADEGHFYIETPDDNSGITIKNGNLNVDGAVKASSFVGDGSGLTNLPGGSGAQGKEIKHAYIASDSLYIVMSDDDTLNVGEVAGKQGDTGDKGDKGDAGPAGITWRGNWESGEYEARDAVYHNGSSYIATGAASGEPGIDTAWAILALKGEKGDPGSSSGAGGDGVGIENAVVRSDSLILALTNKDTVNAGYVKGDKGVGIENAQINSDGDLIISLTDGTQESAGGVVGTDGVSIDTVTIDNSGILTVTLSSGEQIDVGPVKGRDGTSVESASVNSEGELVIKLNNDSEINAGVVKGPKGDAGSTGPVGPSNGWVEDGTTVSSKASVGRIKVSGALEVVNSINDSIVLDSGIVKAKAVWTNFLAYNYAIIGDSPYTQINGERIQTRKIMADSVICNRVFANGSDLTPPDYVFEQDYNLKPLDQVESFIKEHKHLPEIPSAREINEKGLDVVKMNLDLLKKVEELTLYILEQEKKITGLRKEVDVLKTKTE